MKKAIVALVLMTAAFAVQSCGGGEKCPAYSQNETEAPARS